MFTFEHKLKYRRVQRDQSLKTRNQRNRLSKHATIENDCTSLIIRYNLQFHFARITMRKTYNYTT